MSGIDRTPADNDIVATLREAIALAGPQWSAQPSRLRRRLDEVLGDQAQAMRAQVHQLVVAAEERIPRRLEMAGWSETERDAATEMLATTRGWTPEAAGWAVLVWAAALGLTDERPSHITPRPRRAPEPTVMPSDGGLPPATVLPPATSLPPATVLPPAAAATSPTVLPTPTAPPSPAVLPAPPPLAPPPPYTAAGPEPTNPAAPLPPAALPPAPRSTAQVSKFLGFPIDVAYIVRRRLNPIWFICTAPLGIIGIMVRGPIGVTFLAIFAALTFALGPTFHTAYLAVHGERAWLIGARVLWRTTPSKILFEGTRSDLQCRPLKPFPLVEVGGHRVFFIFPTTKAAPLLATGGLR